MDYKKPEFYLKNLPMTDSLKSISNDRIAYALLNAGTAYSERISDTTRATETYESLIKRFPASDLVPEALYNLYKINKGGNSTKAETYRQKLLEKYPGSEYARILSDPEYYEKKMAGLKINEKSYEDAFVAYTNEKFDDAIAICTDALAKYPQNILAPKFMLLHSYVVARTSDERSFKDDLNKLIKAWPGTPESSKAAELVSYLNQKLPELKVEEDKVIAAELYVADTTKIHVFTLVIADPTININQATFDVISYNIDNYTNKNYKTDSRIFDNKYVLITVSGFLNYAQALSYYNTFNTEKIRNPKGAKTMTFLIDDDNLKGLNNDKSPERYLLFFKEKYFK
jgi:outer membrane protein assembly factor BamD (BamD/ComL family)